MANNTPFKGYYSHPSFKGIAVYVKVYKQVWEPYTYLEVDELTGNEYEEDSGDGEWVDNEDTVLVVMAGDDKTFEVDPSELTAIADEEFCDGCGQIGCGHSSYREE